MRLVKHGLGVAVFIILIGGACSDVVYRDRELFNPPLDSINGFLGYYDAAAGRTSCGNCHVSRQGEWEATAHAGAFALLDESAESFCFGCHTVNERGNAQTAPGGWSVVADAAYHDVQCESCHGPGLEHVESPDASQPIPSLAVPPDFDNGCAECHSGNHHPFADQWSQSGHASVVSFAAAREDCESCHRGQGALKAWGVTATYLEQDAPEHLPITCGVCHDPHDATNTGQLRFPVDTRSAEEHLCARCHDRRASPEVGGRLEPHAPEMALLLGAAGWFPPGIPIDPGQIIGTHGSEGNPTLCASCHVSRFTVTDQETGEFQLSSVGHLFAALPCDSSGIPVVGDCAFNTTERFFESCTGSGCHAVDGAASALALASTRVTNASDDLLSQLMQVDPGLDDPGGEVDPDDPIFTVADGSLFNFNLANHRGAVQPSTAHNPFLTEALLLASIDAMEDEYGVMPMSGELATTRVDRLKRLLEKLVRSEEE
jgi:predicted CXXCH cytochrome family protein